MTSFRIVPTYDKKQRENNPNEVEVTPALLLLTQRQASEDESKFQRELKIIRCPTTAVTDWSLEIGALPDPRFATEVQPSKTSITVSGNNLCLCEIFRSYFSLTNYSA